MLGVHVRSTDRATDKGGQRMHLNIIPDQRYIDAIRDYIQKNPETDMIFVASDSKPTLDHLMKYEFGDLILHINATRSNDYKSIHHGHKTSPYLAGMSAVIDAWLLSKCNYHILSASNLNMFALLMQGNGAKFTVLIEVDGYQGYRNMFPMRNREKVGLYEQVI